VTRGG